MIDNKLANEIEPLLMIKENIILLYNIRKLGVPMSTNLGGNKSRKLCFILFFKKLVTKFFMSTNLTYPLQIRIKLQKSYTLVMLKINNKKNIQIEESRLQKRLTPHYNQKWLMALEWREESSKYQTLKKQGTDVWFCTQLIILRYKSYVYVILIRIE